MTETKNTGEKTLSVNPTKTLTLKRGVEQGVVRQSFSHGRTKPVVVEKVKRRVLGPGEARPEPAPAAAPAPKREEEERRRHDEETKRKAEQEAKKRFGEDEAKAKLGPLVRTHV